MAITESQSNLQFTVPVFNAQPNDQQIQEIGLHLQWSENVAVCAPAAPFTYIYRIGENLTVEKGAHTALGSVTPESGVNVGNVAQAKGTLSTTDECGKFYDIDLTFRPPALILTSKATTLILINLPKEISAKALSPSNFSSNFPINPIHIPNIITGNTGKSVDSNFSIKATVSVQTDTGVRMSACEELGSTSMESPSCSSG